MVKNTHEIRDPIHVFIRLDSDERRVVDSRPLQRLRHIHQLALSFLVYPGATHRRFEHSLGVMELAGRVFDIVTHPDAITDEVRSLVPELTRKDGLSYWRKVLRMAALCHDIGHLPFSHAAESELLPAGWNHEQLTRVLIESPEMQEIWDNITPPLKTEHIVKVALGPRKAKDLNFTLWETILSEIITGDAFGVDRIDYLLRDSYHAGVAYGRFDHFRLIDTLRILPSPPADTTESNKTKAVLGVEKGGLHSSEALLIARYFMYSQVYFHHIRCIYDIHLKDFLKEWLEGGYFPVDIEPHLKLTDNEITSAILDAVRTPSDRLHELACRIINRKHFRLLYERIPADIKKNPEAVQAVYEAVKAEFGEENVRIDRKKDKGGHIDFPVLMNDGRIESSLSLSKTLRDIPVVIAEYVFIAPDKKDEAKRWLDNNRDNIIKPVKEEEE